MLKPEWVERDGSVKENRPVLAPLSAAWLWAGAAATLVALLVAAARDEALPPPLPRGAPKHMFSAERASEYLHNLTNVGPRVSGSYEAAVSAGTLARALQALAAGAAPHVRVDVQLHTASGGFPLQFMDGMSNIYRNVQSVVARISAPGRARRSALLINCHYDTVPDSPGASDDGAGCAVVLETARALAAAPGALLHDAVLLLNGAEENIMQASHAFLTTHEWASSVRTFINIEACGAGGRELLFQAGPHDPWLMEVYGSAVPHPFASSLAQEIFESGLVPGDTDFRIFRDVGNLSGVDLAWSANGYVYHTALDTADRIPLGSLQRTGDNVLALAHGLLASPRLDSATDRGARQPVYFDVLGLLFVSARAPLALVLALVTVSLVLARVQRNARRAHTVMRMRTGEYWSLVLHVQSRLALGAVCGATCVVLPALLAHGAGRGAAWYREPRLLLTLYALPSVCISWLVVTRTVRLPRLLAASRWARWQLGADAAALGWAAALAACTAATRRAGYLPGLWAAGAALPALLMPNSARWSCVSWCVGAVLPCVQSCALALTFLQMFVPVLGRAGDHLPPGLLIALVVVVMSLSIVSWLTPLLLSVRRPQLLIWSGLCVCALTHLLVLLTPLGVAHSPQRPQRFMLLHTRRTIHGAEHPEHPEHPEVENGFWLPTLHATSPHTVDEYVPAMREARGTSEQECSSLLYCGAPYFLPVLSLVPAGHWLPAPAPPRARLAWAARGEALNTTTYRIHLKMTGPAHMVVVVSPRAGASVSASSLLAGRPLPGPRWRGRRTYMFTLHDARASEREPATWDFHVDIEHSFLSAPAGGRRGRWGRWGRWAELSLAAHCMFGANQTAPAAATLQRAFPDTATVTGWGVDLHLASV